MSVELLESDSLIEELSSRTEEITVLGSRRPLNYGTGFSSILWGICQDGIHAGGCCATDPLLVDIPLECHRKEFQSALRDAIYRDPGPELS